MLEKSVATVAPTEGAIVEILPSCYGTLVVVGFRIEDEKSDWALQLLGLQQQTT